MYNKMKLKILLSLGHNYRAMRMLGVTVDKLIVLVIPQGCSWSVRRILDLTKRNEVLCPKMKQHELAESLGVAESAFRVYPYDNTPRGKDFLGALSQMVYQDRVEAKEIRNLPIVLMEGVLIDFDAYNCFAVFEEDADVLRVEAGDVVPGKDLISRIDAKIKNFITYDGSMRSALLVAASFLPECVFSDEIFEKYVKVVDEMILEDEENRDQHGMTDLVLQAFNEWQKKTGFCNVRELPNLDMETLANLDNTILYNQEYIYMKDDLYKKIIKDMLPPYSVSGVKMMLCHDDILVADKTNTYSTKVSYTNVAGVTQRARMLQFRRSRMQPLGEIDFITRCLNTKEEMPYED